MSGERGVFPLLKHAKMCETVKKHFSLPFINPDEEPEVNEYKFEFDDMYRTRNAMYCHTLPATFLRSGEKPDELIVTSVKSVADNFEFDVDYDLVSAELRNQNYRNSFIPAQ